MPRPYCHLSLDDRRRVHRMQAKKLPIEEIARALGRHRSTSYRKVRRKTFVDREWRECDGYFPVTADGLAKDRRRRHHKLERHEGLRQVVIEKLAGGWSPEQIAGCLKADGVSEILVCMETLYQFAYSKAGRDLSLTQYLHERRRLHRRRGDRKPRSVAIPQERGIERRPPEVGERIEFGHWDGDLLISGGTTARRTLLRSSSASAATLSS